MATATVRVKNALVSRLQTEMAALTTAQSLPAVVEVLNYDPGIKPPAKSPLVWVAIAEDRRSDSEGRGATLRKYSHRLTVLVGVVVAGQKPTDTATKLEGYADLVRSCLEGEQTVDDEALWALWQATDYTPEFTQQMANFREAVLTFDINRRSTLGGE